LVNRWDALLLLSRKNKPQEKYRTRLMPQGIDMPLSEMNIRPVNKRGKFLSEVLVVY